MTKRIHADVIHAWADGATIQYLEDGGSWLDCYKNAPAWNMHVSYRVKPEPVFKWIALYDTGPYHGYYDNSASAKSDHPHAINYVQVQVT